MPNGALSLAQYPAEMVRLACSRCSRQGRYRKATLLALYGPDAALPTVLTLVAKCEHADSLGRACGAYFLDLVPDAAKDAGGR